MGENSGGARMHRVTRLTISIWDITSVQVYYYQYLVVTSKGVKKEENK